MLVLVTDLFKRPTSSLLRAVNDGQPGWSPDTHLLADVWHMTLMAATHGQSRVTDHPIREAMEAKTRAAAKAARMAELRAKFNERKRQYGNGFGEEA